MEQTLKILFLKHLFEIDILELLFHKAVLKFNLEDLKFEEILGNKIYVDYLLLINTYGKDFIEKLFYL